MHRRIAAAVAACAIVAPAASAQGHAERQDHPLVHDRYHLVRADRLAVHRLLPQLRAQERRTHRPAMRVRMSWNPHRAQQLNTRVRARLAWLRRLPSWHPAGVVAAVCSFWHPCDGALRVFTCESHLSPTATNGQYLGFAQMGDYARARYGWAWDAWSQARAAHAYWLAAGGFGPWTCGYAA